MGDLVVREDEGRLCWLTLNRPDKLNALTVEMFRELRRHVQDLKKNTNVGCVVLRGAGKCFSAGHDLSDILAEETPSRGWHSETLRMMEKLPQPVIAAVHGHCYTGALEMALAADFIVSSDSAKFADTHAKWAFTPIWGMSQRLPRRIGAAAAKRLMFTAETINAHEALRIGLCEAVFQDADFFTSVREFAAPILANSSFSHAANKRLIEATDTRSLDAGLQWEIMETEGVGPDVRERLAAFKGK
ncbi:MAG: short-chain-enoyl-CoA hydratase [Pseudomonadota bacterium]